MIRLSIIIPIYNVEQYLERCLISLIDQDIKSYEYELICVNDGSPDKSRDIVIRFQEEHPNIILIDQENQGVSRARNNGIDKAKGNYILFIDPDDYIESNSLGRILKIAEGKEVEVLFLGFTFLEENGKTREKIFYDAFQSFEYTGIEAYSISRGDGETDADRINAVLFKRDFLNRNNLRFLPDVPYLEDGEFMVRILCVAHKCYFEGNSFYQRTTRPGSATNSDLFYTERASKGFILAASNLKQFREIKDLTEAQKQFLNQPIAKFVLLAINSTLSKKSQYRKSLVVDTLKSRGFSKLEKKSTKAEYRILIKAYNISPLLASIVLYLYPMIKRILKPLKDSYIKRVNGT